MEITGNQTLDILILLITGGGAVKSLEVVSKLLFARFEWRKMNADTQLRELDAAQKRVDVFSALENKTSELLLRVVNEKEKHDRQILEIQQRYDSELTEIRRQQIERNRQTEEMIGALFNEVKNLRMDNLVLLAERDESRSNR